MEQEGKQAMNRGHLVNGRVEYEDPEVPLRDEILFASPGFSLSHGTSPPGCMAAVLGFHAANFTFSTHRNLDADAGTGTVRGDAVNAGDLYLWHGGRPLYAAWDEPLEYLGFVAEPQFLVHAAHETVNPDRLELLPQTALRDPFLEQLALTLQRQYEMHGYIGTLYGETLANAFAVHLLTHYAEFPATFKQYERGLSKADLKRVTDYIGDNLSENISLETLAGLVAISPYYFGKLFEQRVGVAPHQFVIRERVERAKWLLLQEKMNAAQVAVEVGFYDLAHLTRHMKRLLGVNPSHFINGK